MTLMNLLRGRPRPVKIARMVEEASGEMLAAPLAARTVLAKLGKELWWPGGEGDRNVQLGFALRAYASWVLEDAEQCDVDAATVAQTCRSADAVLPLLAILSDGRPALRDHAEQRLIETFGGCCFDACVHSRPLEAALAIIQRADDAESLARWSLTVTAPDARPSIRIAAFVRLRALGSEQEAMPLIDGDDPRLRLARAAVAYSEGRFAEVLTLAPGDSPLSQRAALAAVLTGSRQSPETQRFAEVLASKHPAAAAMLAEATGRYREAAEAWTAAGQPDEARGARALAAPASDIDTDQLPQAIRWYRYAAADGPRPDGTPETPEDKTNSRIGDTRSALAALRVGNSAAVPADAHDAIPPLMSTLERLRQEPRSALGFLAVVDPQIPASTQLAAVAASDGKLAPVKYDAGRWSAWRLEHENVEPLPRPVDPLSWLALRSAGSQPPVTALNNLAVEPQLAVLAALVHCGDQSAIRKAARLLSSPDAADHARRALPELCQLGNAIALCHEASTPERRLGALVAAAALAHRVARGTVDDELAGRAGELLMAAVADLAPDPEQLVPEEAYAIDKLALASFSARDLAKALGPVFCLQTGAAAPVQPPDAVSSLYGSGALAAMLLRVGNVEEAQSAFRDGQVDDSVLEAEIAAAIARRQLAGRRPFDALHEIATLSDPSDLVLVDGGEALVGRIAAAVARVGSPEQVDRAVEDAERLLDYSDSLPQVQLLVVELLLRRSRERTGTLIDDIPDLARAFEIDPEHPIVVKLLAQALVMRAIGAIDQAPEAAVRDVDRATDLFMGDAEFIEVASHVAAAAGAIFHKRRRRTEAVGALQLALAIDPGNEEAQRGLRIVSGN